VRSLSGGAVPLIVVRHGYAVRSFVRVTINSRTYLFAVDTGATQTAIAKPVANALGLPEHGAAYVVHPAGCAARAQPVFVSRWRLGGTRLPPSVIGKANLDLGKEQIHGLPVVGLLGSDVLRQFGRATLQFRQKRLVLGRTAPASGHAAKLTIVRTVTGGYGEFVTVKIHHRAVPLLVDTGAAYTGIDGQLAHRLRLKRLGQSATITGATGCRLKVHFVAIQNWTVDGMKLPSTYALAGPLSLRGNRMIIGYGLLGADVLSVYRQITFDFTAKRLLILGPPKYPARPTSR
jgi:predicted aspartyl protease